MKKNRLLFFFFIFLQTIVFAQKNSLYKIPALPNPAARLAMLKQQLNNLHESPPKIGVRDCFLFLLDGIDTKFLTDEQIEWTLHLVATRVITDSTAKTFGNMYWGWLEKNNDTGDGNNVEFCVQYGILIKILFNDRLSVEAKRALDKIFDYALNGVRDLPVRVSYTNIYLMRIWNLVALGQVYQKPAVIEEGRKHLNIWLNHVSHFGNREYDSPTYSGVALESLILLHRFAKDADIQKKVSDALNFLLNDLCSHYHEQAGFLGGAHSRDYNRVYSPELLEERYLNPLLGKENTTNQLFNQVCLTALKDLGLTAQQKELMNRKDRFIIQRWDSFPNTYACDFVGKKFSIASSNQAYSPDDKSFAVYLSSQRILQMPNITYVMEGRDDHYGTWAAEEKGDKLKDLMPANYPANGGWGKTRHLMPFQQTAQNKNEFVMLVSGEKDHNCIMNHLNSTIILPNYFDEMWMGDHKINIPAVGEKIALEASNTVIARFEDVAIAFRIIYSNADNNAAYLFNDGFAYESGRQSFKLEHNKVLRLTIQHPDNQKATIAMWWKAVEGIKTDAEFLAFRKSILNAPVDVSEKNGVIAVSVLTASGKLGVQADVINKKRLNYYNPMPLPDNFLFNVDGKEIGLPVIGKYN